MVKRRILFVLIFVGAIFYVYRNYTDKRKSILERLKEAFKISSLVAAVWSSIVGFRDFSKTSEDASNSIIPVEIALSNSPKMDENTPKKIVSERELLQKVLNFGNLDSKPMTNQKLTTVRLVSSNKDNSSGSSFLNFWNLVRIIAYAVSSFTPGADGFIVGNSPAKNTRTTGSLGESKTPPKIVKTGTGAGGGNGGPDKGDDGGDDGFDLEKNLGKEKNCPNPNYTPEDGIISRSQAKQKKFDQEDTKVFNKDLEDPAENKGDEKDSTGKKKSKNKSEETSEFDVYLEEFDCTIEDSQIQGKFKHAVDFGVMNKNDREGYELFKNKIIEHMRDPSTKKIEGTFRKSMEVTHYYNEKTNIDVVILKGEQNTFLSGWNLFDSQKTDLENNRNVT